MKTKHKMLISVPTELFEKFRSKCENEYKSISEVVRDYMSKHINEDKNELKIKNFNQVK